MYLQLNKECSRNNKKNCVLNVEEVENQKSWYSLNQVMFFKKLLASDICLWDFFFNNLNSKSFSHRG